MTVEAALHWLAKHLDEHFGVQAKSIAKELLADRMSIDQVQLLTRMSVGLVASVQSKLEDDLSRLNKGEPFAYVIGTQPFYGLSIGVGPEVLIPRPETEELVEWIIADFDSPKRILDIGTGSGCIALALKSAFPEAEVLGIDKSSVAIFRARRNASALQLNVHFEECDVVTQLPELAEFDLVVSNPPYIGTNEQLDSSVIDFEPSMALFTPSADPLYFYELIGKAFVKNASIGAKLYFELSEFSALNCAKSLKDAGLKSIEIKTDLSGKPRMLRCTK